MSVINRFRLAALAGLWTKEALASTTEAVGTVAELIRAEHSKSWVDVCLSIVPVAIMTPFILENAVRHATYSVRQANQLNCH